MATCIYPDCVRYAETYTQVMWCCDLLCICKHSWMNIRVCRLHDVCTIRVHIDSIDGTTCEKHPSDCNLYARLQSDVNISLVQRLAVTNTGVLIVLTDGNCISLGTKKYGDSLYIPIIDNYYKCMPFDITQYEQYTYKPVLDSLYFNISMYLNRLPRDITLIIRTYL